MGLPEPLPPDPEDAPSDNPADWLVGPEEGLAAEMDRRAAHSTFLARPAMLRPADAAAEAPFAPDAGPEPVLDETPGIPLPAPTLSRPTLVPPPAPEPPSAAPAKRFGAVQPEAESDGGFVQGPGMRWEPGPRSVPALHHESRFQPAPEPTRDFPMDDAEERAKSRARDLEAAMADAVAASRPHEVVSPDAFNVEVVPMPWYVQLGHVLRTDRRVQGLLVAGVVILSAVSLWPRDKGAMPIGRIRRHPERFDGVAVQVSGKVGQVFHVGGGYAFYLLDGRDTLVVFTRSRTPVERQHVRISGTMSNGSLDGLPTLALFESASGAN